MGNIIVFIVVVIVVLILAIWLINMLCAGISAPYPLTVILQVIAVGVAIYFICKKAGWL
jgi:hypothetical protein